MFKKIWSLSDQVVLLKRLGELLEKGYSLLQALEFLRFQLPLEKKVQLQRMIDGLKDGKSLHDSFHQLMFHQEMLSYLFYAEQHGDISFALQQGSALLYKKVKYRKDMMKIMQYPMFLAFFLIIMIFVFNRILLPQVDMVYSSFGSTAPLLTEQILSTIKLLPYLMFSTIFIFMIGCSLYMFYFRKLPHMQQVKIMLRIPLIKTFLIIKHSHYFATQLSGLLHGGLSVLEALTIMMEQKYHPFFQYEAGRIERQLIAGEPLQSIIAKSGYYEKELSYIITHGQANGNLAIELGDYSDLIMEKMEQKIKRMLVIIQPILFTCIGGIVVLMYLAMIMPMFQMMNSI
ncbi:MULTISPECIES: competence type IV pilus assembly protein ComGB [Bacillus]|uniref:competence type IV pilus assembly protein ComGB n=1 Tax=Bacillus TaxID=1386 RepID=UPI00032E1224|nr:type II secretion system F family protein [Bacillus wiedmannii]EOP13141.1 ComG operon protein 2 [Bacillus cereus BAG2O-3]EOQ09950.1 ComG operon protein 2 [Bacillus cereus B5-2]EOQ27969.1 ComG operon protein 2 [Bacillus cereus BAG3O-1]MBJ8114549.1 type II secretion system F family protein [Bacillus cereus]PFW83360.1 competence protein ComG [Bacillus sp. AFS075960]RFB16610.1 type II secretion system F family protein [Bacillus sp. OE]RFB24548.1 type II secretion system F family protein [Baci